MTQLASYYNLLKTLVGRARCIKVASSCPGVLVLGCPRRGKM